MDRLRMAAAKKESIRTAEANAVRTQRMAAAEASGVLTVSSEKGHKPQHLLEEKMNSKMTRHNSWE